MSDSKDSVVELAPELRLGIEQAEAQKNEVDSLLAMLTDAQLNWRPAPDRWSIGEHIEHLALAAMPYFDTIDRVVADARARGLLRPPPYRHGWVGEWFARSMEPPVKVRVRTNERLVPQATARTTSGVRDAFMAAQNQLVRSLRNAQGVDLGKTRMRSPYLSALRLSIGSAFRVILAHNRRHIWHAHRILENPELPGGQSRI